MHHGNSIKDISRQNVETINLGFDARLNYFQAACERMVIADHVASGWVLVAYPLVAALVAIAFIGYGIRELVR
jgi:hypothetical protein